MTKWIIEYDKEWKKHNPGFPSWNNPVEGPKGSDPMILLKIPKEFLKILEEKEINYKEI